MLQTFGSPSICASISTAFLPSFDILTRSVQTLAYLSPIGVAISIFPPFLFLPSFPLFLSFLFFSPQSYGFLGVIINPFVRPGIAAGER